VTETLEHTARKIADRGREALLARLRPAFEEAAAAHSDVLELEPEQIEQMVQRAADKADGLQWRRALASVATEELGIGLGEALSHPAVARAQAIVGAPSYEESLAALGDPPAVATPAAPVPPPDPVEEAAAAEAAGLESEAEPEDEAVSEDQPEAEPGPETAEHVLDEPAPPGPPAAPGELRLTAVHLGGIAGLAAAEPELELRLSGEGLDVVRRGDVFGRLTWNEITELDVPEPRGLMKRRRTQAANLVIRSRRGDASFEIPGVSHDELRAQVDSVRAG
jgi:hypothetical protein